jgi:hypothetical protein
MSIDSRGNFPRNGTGSSTPSNHGSSSVEERPDWWRQQSSPPDTLNNKSAASAAEDVLSKTKDTARATAKALASQASELAGNIGSELTQTADEQKGRGADAMRGFAKALHGAADDLDGQSPGVARYARKAAESVESLSDTVRSRSVNDLVVAAKDTARAHPTAFFVGAVAAGFALSRFFKSSARTADTERTGGARGDQKTGATRETGSLDLGGRS